MEFILIWAYPRGKTSTMVSLRLTIFTSLLASCYGSVHEHLPNVTVTNAITIWPPYHGPCFPHIGCFPSTYPWDQRGVYPDPWSPQDIGIYVTLYTRRIKTQKKIEIYPSTPDLRKVGYRPTKPTHFIIHGFTGDGERDWMKRIKDAILKLEDANVFLVDWARGARGINYFRAVSNTRVVGAVLAWFTRDLNKNYKQKASKMHVIGFSLGGQVASYMGKAAQNPPPKEWPALKYKKITALDPAGPGYEGFSEEIRLYKTDAEFVEVIHTNGRPIIPKCGFGMISPVGHVDYYMNGGGRQPGCFLARNKEQRKSGLTEKELLSMPMKELEKLACVGCSHMRATLYYAEALETRLKKKCLFMGYKLSKAETYHMIDYLYYFAYFVYKPAHLPKDPSRQRCLAHIGYDHSKVKGVLYVPIYDY